MLSGERIERLRKSLLEQQGSLRRLITGLEATSQGIMGASSHMAEDATAAFDQAAAVSLRRGHEATLGQVEQALERMRDGRYGACERCAGEIDFARLKAVPYATLCFACQRLAEA